ncbi:hypothetical protein ABLE91_19250 [Aquabacter sp. CN5-332]|uniref:hypothetical protein n=1 Tax=Aquabacter sp. CN5-332 TaxID=3156608 RepID=UPI0032B5162B
MRDDRGQLRSYFNAAKTVKMGILRDGLIWEFYADSDLPNMMDENPFLRFDMKDLAKGQAEDSAVEGLFSLGKAAFDPENIGAEAKRKHVYNSVINQITALAEEPSDAFIRDLLSAAGFQRVSQKAVEEYRPTVKAAFRDFISRRILQRLDLPQMEIAARAPETVTPLPTSTSSAPLDERVQTTETELRVFAWVKQRLAFLVREDALFKEIEHIAYQDFQGSFVVYYKRLRAGRLLELYEPRTGSKETRLKVAFPAESGAPELEMFISDLAEMDEPLLAIFKARASKA